ncbi:MAG: hypothetical protein Q9217_007029, partial [Psora testacea]
SNRKRKYKELMQGEPPSQASTFSPFHSTTASDLLQSASPADQGLDPHRQGLDQENIDLSSESTLQVRAAYSRSLLASDAIQFTPPTPQHPSAEEETVQAAGNPEIACSAAEIPLTQSPPIEPSTPASTLQSSTLPALFPGASSLPTDFDSSPSRTDPEALSERGGAGSESDMTTVTQARYELEKKHFFYDNGEANKRGKVLVEKAKAILCQPRGSPTAKKLVPQIRDAIQKSRGLGEMTLIFNVWQVLKDNHRQYADRPIPPDVLPEDIQWTKRAWELDYFGFKINATFKKNSIPDKPELGSELLNKIFKEMPRIADPKPDIAIGLSRNDLPEGQRAIFDRHHCDITQGLYHVFFCIEAKTEDLPPGEAENQCIRTGAAAVNNRREWNLAANPSSRPQSLPSFPRQDLDSFTFSLALTPSLCTMHVHWCEEWPNEVEHWHAHPLRSYDLRFDGPLEELGMHMRNIFDWGLGERKREIEEQYHAIVKRTLEESTSSDAKRQKTKS